MTKISLNLNTRNASHSLTHTQGRKLLGLIFFLFFPVFTEKHEVGQRNGLWLSKRYLSLIWLLCFRAWLSFVGLWLKTILGYNLWLGKICCWNNSDKICSSQKTIFVLFLCYLQLLHALTIVFWTILGGTQFCLTSL